MINILSTEFYKNLTDDKKQRLLKRLTELNTDIKNKGIRTLSSDGGNYSFGTVDLLTGYSYNEFYDWDLYFENIYMSYYGISRYCRNNLEAFLDRQLECGFVARTLIIPRMRQHFKPFIAQTALLGCRQIKNFEWLRDKYYEKIKKYLDYWFKYCDYDKNGLCIWDSADHSGMDNQDLRAGKLYEMVCEGVDLNCYLVRELYAMIEIASQLGINDGIEDFKTKAQNLCNLINDIFWDEKDGFYYDRNEQTGEKIRIKSVAGFTPLWLGIASKEQAERLVKEHLINKDEFWLSYPVATWAKNEPGYYQQKRYGECNWMGTCWIPTNYMIFHGLKKYGYYDIAKELAEKTFELVLNEEDTREYYNAETGIGQGLNPFWGWSSLGYFMPFEDEMDYDPSDLNSDIIPIANELLSF